jgi:hypothetical protein
MSERTKTYLAPYARVILGGLACLTAVGALGCSQKSPAPEQRELGRFSVLATTRRSTTSLVELSTVTERVVTTPEHPFARTTGWTPAGELKVGDVIETASGTTRVVGMRQLQVPPTEVYNLTIDQTHAYFAGRSGLLVHNVDCKKPTLGELLAAERAEELRKKYTPAELAAIIRERRYQEELRRSQVEQRIKTLKERIWWRNNRLTLNDSNDPRAQNCIHCSLAALSDADKLSTFLREHGYDENKELFEKDLPSLLRKQGLTHVGTAEAKSYSRADLVAPWTQLLKNGADRRTMDMTPFGRLPEASAREFMKSTHGNTNIVAFRSLVSVENPRGSGKFEVKSVGHAVTAVRHEDGSVVYVEVFPTDVDWRYNRQLFAAVRSAEVRPRY